MPVIAAFPAAAAAAKTAPWWMGAAKTVGGAVLGGIATGAANRVQQRVQGSKGARVFGSQDIATRAYETSFGQPNANPYTVPSAIKVANIQASSNTEVAQIQAATQIRMKEMQMRHDLLMTSIDKTKSGVRNSLRDLLFGGEAEDVLREHEALTNYRKSYKVKGSSRSRSQRPKWFNDWKDQGLLR